MRNLAAGANIPYHYGISLVDLDAFNAATLPDANDATEQPGWLVRGSGNATTSALQDHSQYVSIIHDLKAKRKFAGNNFALVFMINNAGASDLQIDGMLRIHTLRN